MIKEKTHRFSTHVIQVRVFYDYLPLGQDTAFSEALINDSCLNCMLISMIIRLWLLRRWMGLSNGSSAVGIYQEYTLQKRDFFSNDSSFLITNGCVHKLRTAWSYISIFSQMSPFHHVKVPCGFLGLSFRNSIVIITCSSWKNYMYYQVIFKNIVCLNTIVINTEKPRTWDS